MCDSNLNYFQAHRVVLAASCAYFDAMFNVGLEESQKGYVALPSVPPDILPMIIDFIYTGISSLITSNLIFIVIEQLLQLFIFILN